MNIYLYSSLPIISFCSWISFFPSLSPGDLASKAGHTRIFFVQPYGFFLGIRLTLLTSEGESLCRTASPCQIIVGGDKKDQAGFDRDQHYKTQLYWMAWAHLHWSRILKSQSIIDKCKQLVCFFQLYLADQAVQ